MYPNIELVKNSIEKMANEMGCEPLPEEKAELLIEHVLYDGIWKGVEGKDGWRSFEAMLITEREIRNLLMQHSRTKIAKFNGKCEFDLACPFTKTVCQSFEIALLGRLAKLSGDENLDYWEETA
ncbi:hypothetical protein [Spartinivicinus ruber]|uniref:hypothetical protein n=1 Tax=Spartinivicinus ruber TaxID=2683272 RepID=UPI0013D76648|nr:hypothetical protein [Spartinivicinus ruber]